MRYNTDQKNSNEHFSRSVLFLRIATIYSINIYQDSKTRQVVYKLIFCFLKPSVGSFVLNLSEN